MSDADALQEAFKALLESQRLDGLLMVQVADGQIEIACIVREGSTSEDEIRMLEHVRKEIDGRIAALKTP